MRRARRPCPASARIPLLLLLVAGATPLPAQTAHDTREAHQLQTRQAAPAAAPMPTRQEPLAGLEDYIREGMGEWRIPGLSIAVVKDDEPVFVRGFGVRELGSAESVDEHTLFNVASLSKAFTSAALALLVEDDLLAWDDPVVRHLPWFELYDPWVTANVTVRDLLTHRVGVGRMTGNRLQWLTHRPREELIRRIRHLEPEQPFRRGYVYSNVMYMVAGELIPAITGTSWDDFVRERLFAPLGMRTSLTSVTQLGAADNVAAPHQEIDGVVRRIPRRNFDNVGPAASIYTSASEIAEWMRLHLGDPGQRDGVRLLGAATVAELHRAQNALPEPAFEPLSSYALGWRIGDHRGRRISQHGGAVDGMNSWLVLVPEENLGVFVTTNLFNSFMTALANEVIDRYLEARDRDWNALYHDAWERQRARAQAGRDAIHAARQEGTRPSLPLDAYVGEYVDDLYADVEVRLGDRALELHFWNDATLVADLEHWHHDTFRAVWRNPAQREKFVYFTRGPTGHVARLHVEWALRPDFLPVGIYPSHYTRTTVFERSGPHTAPLLTPLTPDQD